MLWMSSEVKWLCQYILWYRLLLAVMMGRTIGGMFWTPVIWTIIHYFQKISQVDFQSSMALDEMLAEDKIKGKLIIVSGLGI